MALEIQMALDIRQLPLPPPTFHPQRHYGAPKGVAAGGKNRGGNPGWNEINWINYWRL